MYPVFLVLLYFTVMSLVYSQALIRRQLELEEEIDIKANTLFIDETECQGMRKSISIQAY